MSVRQAIVAGLMAAGAATAAAQGPRLIERPAGPARAHADAFLEALASGDARRFEAMAKEHFTPELYGRRTAQDRGQMVARVRADFGTLTVTSLDRRAGGPMTLDVRGTTGLEGRIELTFEPPPLERIARVGIEVGEAAARNDGPPPEVHAGMSAADLARGLDAWLEPLAASGRFSGVVLVAKAGQAVYEKAFGLSDRGRGLANAAATRFNLGSINKIFTKTAIAQLVAAGKLKRSDTLGALLPDYPNADTRAATVDQLLDHQAGVADFFGPAFDAADKTAFRSNADYYRHVSSQPALFPPGTRRQYCNGCYIVLGAIIEKVSGQPYEDYIAQHVYARAGMTGAQPTGAGAATGYTRREVHGERAGPPRSNAPMLGAAGSAAGGGFATARDLLAFDTALRAGRLADPVQTAWLLHVAEVTPGRSDGAIGIAGGAPGINAILESSRDWTVVVLANLDPPAAERVGVAIHRRLAR